MQNFLTFSTAGRGTINITEAINQAIADTNFDAKLCHLFILHTSASLIVCENADPLVHADLERYFARLVPDGDPLFEHTDEGPDDMSAHVRSVLTQTSLLLPVRERQLLLGTWQGVYLWEHRTGPHQRKIVLTLL
ncbi:MAG: secondary thiamine-phosphate synthase enzyme YjbQ [Gammaproteobacteria bacterium]